MVLSISVLCTYCSLNRKDHNGAYYFEEVSPGLPARAGAVPGHHHLMWAAVPEPCLGVRRTWSEIWAIKGLCLTVEMEADGLWNKDVLSEAEGAAGDHPWSRCKANPIFTGWQTLPLDITLSSCEMQWLDAGLKAPHSENHCTKGRSVTGLERHYPSVPPCPSASSPTLCHQIWHHQSLGAFDL